MATANFRFSVTHGHHEQQTRAFFALNLLDETFETSTNVRVHPSCFVLRAKPLDEREQTTTTQLACSEFSHWVSFSLLVIEHWRLVGCRRRLV